MPRIYVLGAGTPTPTADRFGSSYVLELDGQYLMFDCGPAATHKLVQAGCTQPKSPTCFLPITTLTMM